MFNKIILIGRLGADPTQKYTVDGKAVTSFSVAVDTGYGANKKALWYKVSTFGKLAENCNQYLVKGSLVVVSGRETEPWVYQGKDGQHRAQLQVMADEVRFASTKGDNQESKQDEWGEPASPTIDEEEIPF